jgi:NAD(P)-dependent dehydrogenase (short-subunit alcohol dehydrogenase family)
MSTDPVAIVTGASRGIGKQVALRLAGRGFRLVVAARTETTRQGTPGTLAETAAELRSAGVDVLAVRADLSSAADVDRLAATALDQFGRADVLVNNAAYTVGRTLFTHVPDLTRNQWDKHFAINVTAPLMLIQACWPSMVEHGGGVVVNMTSRAALPVELSRRPDIGLPENGPAYGASKAALNKMANVIACEGALHRIAVINVEPGFVLTETMAETLGTAGVADTTAIPMAVPAAVIEYLCTCTDAMAYSGSVVDGPLLHRELGLV